MNFEKEDFKYFLFGYVNFGCGSIKVKRISNLVLKDWNVLVSISDCLSIVFYIVYAQLLQVICKLIERF